MKVDENNFARTSLACGAPLAVAWRVVAIWSKVVTAGSRQAATHASLQMVQSNSLICSKSSWWGAAVVSIRYQWCIVDINHTCTYAATRGTVALRIAPPRSGSWIDLQPTAHEDHCWPQLLRGVVGQAA